MPILVGNCAELMADLEPCSVDAVVTDPPYLLGFMGKAWDKQREESFHYVWAEQAIRVLKPGGHLLAFGGTRTYHRLACALEDAGFEIRDCLVWMYGSGFPKSLDVSKAIDKAAGAEREVVGRHVQSVQDRKLAATGFSHAWQHDLTVPATPEAQRWQGWGTALKPAHEPIVVARKPLAGTVAGNVLATGCGALNVDGCRIGRPDGHRTDYGLEVGAPAGIGYHGLDGRTPYDGSAGRWPANVVLDEEAASLLPFDVARFFYTAKASRAERNAGLEGFEGSSGQPARNPHPTVKPIALMRWLVRLVTPPGGLCLDPFAGSGTTGVACALEGFEFIGCEQDAGYAKIAEARIRFWQEHGEDGLRIVAERERAELERQEIAASGQLDIFAEKDLAPPQGRR